MTFLPETVRFRWRSLEPLMQAGAIMSRSASDGLFHVEGAAGGGLTDRAVEALEHHGYVRRIGVAYVAAPWRPLNPTPLEEEVYPAITLWQPWASLVAEQAKPWDFRSRLPPWGYIGRRIAIHAAVRPLNGREIRLLVLRLQVKRATALCMDDSRAWPLVDYVQQHPQNIQKGVVLCTAVLGEPIRSDQLRGRLQANPVNSIDKPAPGAWAWPLTKIERLALPAPARGKVGWWWWRP